MGDWGAVRKRLEEMDEDHFDPNDIRAALERVEELEQANRTINRAQMAMVKRAEASEAKLARLEGLILDWDDGWRCDPTQDPGAVGRGDEGLMAEARRIRAAKGDE